MTVRTMKPVLACTASLLLTLLQPVSAEAQLAAATVRVDVAATKVDGSPWDALGGLPDIALCITRPGTAQRCEPVQCNDILTCVFENVAWEPGSTLTVVDADAFSGNDPIGSGVCSPGPACVMGQATVTVVLPAASASGGAAVTWASVRDAEGMGEPMERVWNPPGVRLAVGARPEGASSVIYLRPDVGTTEWHIVEVPLSAELLSVDVAALPDGRLLVRVLEREPHCGTLCDEPGVMADMARAPIYRGYFLMRWDGSAPAFDEQWTTTEQSARPPRWLRRFL